MSGNLTIVPFLAKVNEVILNPIIYLLFALALVYFLYSVVRFLRLESGDSARKEAKNAIMWGLFGMVIMFSVYGIIALILNTFGVGSNDLSPGANQFLTPTSQN